MSHGASATRPDVLVVGAGPTGLVLAIWLTRLGVSVRVIDKSPEPADESRALGVHARTLEFYRQVDLADRVIKDAVQVAGVNFWVGGRRFARLPVKDSGEGQTPYPSVWIYPQDRHERLLLGHLQALGVAVERPTELLALDQPSGDGVRATLKTADRDEETCEVAFLAGCDGGHSRVREALAIDFPGGTYSRLFYVADVEADGPPIDEDVHVDLDEADLLAVFPLKGDNRARLVGTVRDDTGEKAYELSFADVSDRAIEQLKLTVSKVNWFSTYRVHHRVAHGFRSGRVFLLGDAGHVHSPVGAQGMNTGIGDAVNLAWKLAAVVKDEASESLLATYDPERISFARRLVATTDRFFTVAVKEGPTAARLRTKVVPIIIPPLFRVPPLRRSFFRTLSQIGINYRESPLSAGGAGSVRGGDRLPWVKTGQGEDNFAALTSLAWQVHVYGQPRSGLADACTQLGLTLHVFDWAPAAKRAGLERGALYLVRPDGYVALADGDGDADTLRRYLAERGLHRQSTRTENHSG